MPVVHPADIWKETGRWYKIDAEMARFQDRSGRDMVLAMTHEEVIADLVRRQVHSYRQLPQVLFHIQTKFRDDPRPRAGLIRVREFTMKDSYSLDTDWEGLNRQYQAHYQAYFNIFRRCGLPAMAVKADVGMMGGNLAHEFMYLTDIGEDTLLLCNACGSSANRQVATFRKALPDVETLLPAEKVATPGCKSIEDLTNFLDISKTRTAKAVFLMATIQDGEIKRERLIFAVIRGDMEVNETKLANAIKAQALRPATEAEIRSAGATPGYASPVGLKDVLVIVDDAIPHSPNLVAGANEEGYHMLNTNYGRDYRAEIVTDIATAQDGNSCPRCNHPLRGVRGVEVGNIFKLGTHFSESMGCTYLDADGHTHPVVMGSYGIGVGRLMACIAEEHHDEYGLVWPISVAPYPVHLVVLAGKGSNETLQTAEKLYADLQSAGIDTLYDDRAESPGVKFNDADLIGLPIRLTVSERALKAGGVELKRRDLSEREVIPLDQLLPRLKVEIAALQSQIDQSLTPINLEEI
jgi:prolyl-tRNA synthetase